MIIVILAVVGLFLGSFAKETTKKKKFRAIIFSGATGIFFALVISSAGLRMTCSVVTGPTYVSERLNLAPNNNSSQNPCFLVDDLGRKGYHFLVKKPDGKMERYFLSKITSSENQLISRAVETRVYEEKRTDGYLVEMRKKFSRTYPDWAKFWFPPFLSFSDDGGSFSVDNIIRVPEGSIRLE